MVRTTLIAVFGSLRDTAERSRKAVVALGGLLLVEVGGRIALPGLNVQVLSDFLLHRGGGGLLSLYDRLVGGAVSRGAVLALGIMPYLSARVFVRLARATLPSVGAMETDEAGLTKPRWGTRVLTVGLALVQSYGFAQLAQAIPGAVTRPGTGFVIQTMLTLTAGAIVAMALAEQVTGQIQGRPQQAADDEPTSSVERGVPSVEILQSGDGVPLLPPGQLDAVPEYRPQRETVKVPR